MNERLCFYYGETFIDSPVPVLLNFMQILTDDLYEAKSPDALEMDAITENIEEYIHTAIDELSNEMETGSEIDEEDFLSLPL
jgi:hypothetical protein